MEISQKHVNNSDQLLKDMSECHESRASASEQPLLADFARAVVKQFPTEDWLKRPVEDLSSAFIQFLGFINNRLPERILVDVFNPTLEQNGWICGRTVVLISCKDKPFVVDSVRIVFEQSDCAIHVSKSTVLSVERDKKGNITSLSAPSSETEAPKETFAYFEITALADQQERKHLAKKIEESLGHVAAVVADYEPMQAQVEAAYTELEGSFANDTARGEVREFLSWLRSSNFTFLGYRELAFDSPLTEGDNLAERTLIEAGDKRLGIFKQIDYALTSLALDQFPQGAKDFYRSAECICFSKSGTRSTVHRNVYPDYIVLKMYNDEGQVIGERRFLGFFTYAVSSMSPDSIPILRDKVSRVVDDFGLNPRSHDGKRLKRAIDLHPKDEFFQSSTTELCETLKKIVSLNERDIVRFLARKDPFGQFVSCLIYVPKDLYTTSLRLKIQKRIGDELNTDSADVTTFFSESKHARAHMIFRVPDNSIADIDLDALEPEIIELAHGWIELFQRALIERFGERQGSQKFKDYNLAFPQSYQEQFDARSAVDDLDTFENLKDESSIAMRLYQPLSCKEDELKFRVAHLNSMLELSDVIPILEAMGLRVMGEQPFKIVRKDKKVFWLHDFQLKLARAGEFDMQEASASFEDAFAKIWNKQIESDAFNQLILVAGLNWQQVNLLRAYASYMKQTLFQISLDYIADTLVHHPIICKSLLELFSILFDPRSKAKIETRKQRAEEINANLEQCLEEIKSLNQDKVVRRYIELINATLRTNFYQKPSGETDTPYLSIKFSPAHISDIPEPKPAFEFFVYSARVEGVHLRTSKVARGGLRWSDRLEDYRTEVLGLVKAQQVKNAVIVPSGAKGGFVAKQLPINSTRAVFLAEGVECYKIFIRGLLDLTDNLLEAEIVKPKHVVCLDDDDAYLVVAADKGTATFSDIANEISNKRGHWLGDAFASGGSKGYDHKGMGITAKGAWVGVQRHFREHGINTQTDEFTVIGVGDMAGDVFGNGMLLSRTIKLVAAFNHMHIFIDPQPDAEQSFLERERLFNTQGTNWADYNSELISSGGGIFSRNDKFIHLSAEIKQLLGSDESRLTPTDLISALLRSEVDLIWNGGIGTYVKAESELHSEVGDKANDCLRVNGRDLRCKVFGEGGNLGMTQRGRIEFSQQNGACNTDFIDNAAGVDCSDHEVNIKILIDAKVAAGDLTDKQRNQLLVDMTDSVSELVLANNYAQTQAISIAEQQVSVRMHEYRRFIRYLEEAGKLDRALEFLPSDAEIVERLGNGSSLARPELCVLISYAKVQLKEILAVSSLDQDDYCARSVFSVFPPILRERYAQDIEQHKLRREIIATQLANDFINNLGITALHRLSETTGATAEEIVKAYVAARDIFDLNMFIRSVATLDHKTPTDKQYELIASMARRVRRGTRWFLKNRRRGLEVGSEIDKFKDALKAVQHEFGTKLPDTDNAIRTERMDQLSEVGVSSEWMDVLVMPDNMFSGMGVVEIHLCSGADVKDCTEIFITLMEQLKLNWFATQLAEIHVETYWQANAREAYIDDLESQLRKLSTLLLSNKSPDQSVADLIEQWQAQNEALINRWTTMVNKVEGTSKTDYAMFSVALRELNDLVQVTTHS